MCKSNFSRLIDEIDKQRAEIYNQGHQKTISKSLPSPRKKGPTFKEKMSSLHKAARATGRSLNKKIKHPPLSKSQRRMINRTDMRNLSERLTKACMNKELTANEACLLETKLNHLSTALASKGLL